MIIAKQKIGIVFREVFIIALISMILTTLFIFTISFFSLKTLNRYIFLPQLFPRGHIQELEKVVFLSIKKVNRIYYTSVTILPSIYLLSIIYSMYIENSDERIVRVLTLFAIIFVVCFFIHIVFTDYFNTPLSILIKGVERIKNGTVKVIQKI